MTDQTQSGSKHGCLCHCVSKCHFVPVQTNNTVLSSGSITMSAVFSIVSMVLKYRSSVVARCKLNGMVVA